MGSYRKAQAIINKKLPELMELKKGCEVILKYRIDSNYSSFTFVGENNRGEHLYRYNGSHSFIFTTLLNAETGESLDKLQPKPSYFDDKYGQIDKIIGQPITLQSLLRYLQKSEKRIIIEMYAQGDILFISGDRDKYRLDLDLSKPPQEWGEEKWGEILELIKQL